MCTHHICCMLTYAHTLHVCTHIQVLAFVLIIPAATTQTQASPFVNPPNPTVFAQIYAAAGWLLFVAVNTLLIETSIVAIRFLNLGLIEKYTLPLVITVSGAGVCVCARWEGEELHHTPCDLAGWSHLFGDSTWPLCWGHTHGCVCQWDNILSSSFLSSGSHSGMFFCLFFWGGYWVASVILFPILRPLATSCVWLPLLWGRGSWWRILCSSGARRGSTS